MTVVQLDVVMVGVLARRIMTVVQANLDVAGQAVGTVRSARRGCIVVCLPVLTTFSVVWKTANVVGRCVALGNLSAATGNAA